MQNSWIASIVVACGAGLFPLTAGAQSADEQRALLARDICVGVAAKFANGPPGSDISFQSGKFSVRGANGSLTIFENAVSIANIPGFNYSNYNNCLDTLISGFEQNRRASEAKSHLEAFSAGYELSETLNVGICMNSAAMGGYYIGDMQNNNVPLQRQRLQQLALSVSKSVSRRIRRLSASAIDLNLADDLAFYSYYADRPVPYFPGDAIQRRLDDLNDAIPDGELDYAGLGALVGRMQREHLYGGALMGMLQAMQFRPDERAARAQTYFPPSIQCLVRNYGDDTNRLRRAANDLGISRLSIPQLAPFSFDANSSMQYTFSNSVTAEIRRFLKGDQ
ncbi:hypothetical protein [Bradyrhizobium liaoningense]|uniref:hypothetical protein n=1 Tax=Bradyrhizobium liaoningense TaxID=43992 RepID=UPI001BAE38CB|nr:hypothetical protein [Bradyrhizobium liaoningense]MBR0941583.1 hypothetical protein [Bradyrhizobium liaoningense]